MLQTYTQNPTARQRKIEQNHQMKWKKKKKKTHAVGPCDPASSPWMSRLFNRRKVLSLAGVAMVCSLRLEGEPTLPLIETDWPETVVAPGPLGRSSSSSSRDGCCVLVPIWIESGSCRWGESWIGFYGYGWRRREGELEWIVVGGGWGFGGKPKGGKERVFLNKELSLNSSKAKDTYKTFLLLLFSFSIINCISSTF